jgi:hypothetical protein
MPSLTATNSEAWKEIFKAAVTSPLGIMGLTILVAGCVIIALFGRKDDPRTKLLAVGVMFLFFVVLVSVAVYTVQPTTVKTTGAMTPAFLPTPHILALSSSHKPASVVRLQAREASDQGCASCADPAEASIQLKLVQAAESLFPPSLAAGVAQVSGQIDCGTAWTEWVDPEVVVGNPCPTGCTRGAELARNFKVVGFPPHPQVRYKFQCWRS